MKRLKAPRHWLSKAEPNYAPVNGQWRVRAMRRGKAYNWWLKAGKGDGGSTGRALATAEWSSVRRSILAKEASESAVADGGDFYWNWTAEEQDRHDLAVAQRSNWEQSPFAHIPYEDWLEFTEWQRQKRQAVSIERGEPIAVAAQPTAAKPFKELTAVFKAHLSYRLKQTVKGMRSKEDISEARYGQYGFALAHMDNLIGNEVAEPFGDYQISEQRLSALLGRYREKTIAEMKAKKHTGHWLNERMKTARALTSYLVENRLCSATPPNIYKLTEKYEIDPNPSPIDVPILKTIWAEADNRMRAFILLALNCGFRQTEIGSLNRSHVKTIGGRVCIEKRRGKTGVPIAIPLWRSTQLAIDTFGNATGNLFDFGEGHKAAIEVIGNRFAKIRARAIKQDATAKHYSFENFRDTGASFIETINPMLTPLYLGQTDKRTAKYYVGQVNDSQGQAVVPMQLDTALDRFETYLALPPFEA